MTTDHRPQTFLDIVPVEQLQSIAERRCHAPGSVLLAQDETTTFVAVIVAGAFQVARVLDDGRQIVLALRGPGEVVGELAALDRRPRSATVTALRPADVLIVPGNRFLALLRDHDAAAIFTYQMLSQRVRECDEKRAELAACDTMQRIARTLTDLARRLGHETGEGELVLEISQAQLAEWTASSREAVAKALRVFRAMGWVRTRRGQITIVEPDSLARRGS